MSALYGACSQEGCGCLHFDGADDSPRECDCGHLRCFHAPSTAASTPRSGRKSVSDLVAPIFEGEVNYHLTNHLSHSLPQCGLSDFRTREIEGCDALEIDSFGYMSHDSLEFGVDSPGSGISVIEPNGCTRAKAVAAPPGKLTGSPGAMERSLETKVEKYVIGETYSGQRETKIKEKVEELEAKIHKMVERFKGLNTSYSGDVTSVVGATLLAYSCGPMKRKDAARKFSRIILSTLTEDSMPNLWRLAQARRLYLVVMSANDSPNSTAHRETYSLMEGMDIRMEGMDITLMSIQEAQETIQESQETIQGKLDKALKK